MSQESYHEFVGRLIPRVNTLFSPLSSLILTIAAYRVKPSAPTPFQPRPNPSRRYDHESASTSAARAKRPARQGSQAESNTETIRDLGTALAYLRHVHSAQAAKADVEGFGRKVVVLRRQATH